jgi:hypothetical protein
MKKDSITIRILPDGRLVATTGKISMKNHMEADKALAELTELLGGESEIESTKKTDHHHHNHNEGGHHHDH